MLCIGIEVSLFALCIPQVTKAIDEMIKIAVEEQKKDANKEDVSNSASAVAKPE